MSQVRAFAITWVVFWSLVMLAIGMPFFTYVFMALLPWTVASMTILGCMFSLWYAEKREQWEEEKEEDDQV